MADYKFKVGDKVRVVDYGKTHDTHWEKLLEMGFMDKQKCDLIRSKNEECVVFSRSKGDKHSYNKPYYGVKCGSLESLISEEGLELIEIEEPKTKSDYKFKVGDRVKVIDNGYVYELYYKMFELFGFDNLENNFCDNGDVGVIIATNIHEHTGELLYALSLDNGKQVVIDKYGIELHLDTRKKTNKKVTKIFKRNIPSDMLKVWQKLRKTNDPQLLAEHCGVSYITAIRFITYGYVSKRKNINLINEYFINTCGQQEKDVALLKKIAEKYDF